MLITKSSVIGTCSTQERSDARAIVGVARHFFAPTSHVLAAWDLIVELADASRCPLDAAMSASYRRLARGVSIPRAKWSVSEQT
jgi:hypothetical protein